MPGATYGWGEISRERKREIIDAIVAGKATRGPVHAELDLTDRCNVSCYFCNQQDVRTKEFVSIERAKEIIDELADGGLRSVRLSGGGDPLFHKDILALLDHLAARGIVIDNLTTNAVLMGAEVAARLVRDKAREVVVSLNAANPADYQRMMKVKGSLFDRVLDNVRQLRLARGEAQHPQITVQFLLDRENFAELPRMYEIAREAGADRVAVNPVMDIPLERIDQERLLTSDDLERVRPHFEELFRRDLDRRIVAVAFPTNDYNAVIEEAKRAVGYESVDTLRTAPSFKDENGHCFFGWYTMTVRGNGDLYPCCMLMNPSYPPLGNAAEGKIADHWNGERFTRLRSEMREVMLRKGEVFYQPARFETIRKQCIEPGACWLKNSYFRGDEEFYGELGEALEVARRKERSVARELESAAYRSPRLRAADETLRVASRPFRSWMKRRLHLNVAGTSLHE